MPKTDSKNGPKSGSKFLTKSTGKRLIGTITFLCIETGQLAEMSVHQNGEMWSMTPRIDSDEDAPVSVTMELWNRFCGHIKQDLENEKQVDKQKE